jgi:hypothetical protein
MTAFLRTTFLAAVAVSSLAGSAFADQTIPSCAKTSPNDQWGGRCCSVGVDCLHEGHDHGDHGHSTPGGRGSNGGGSTAGKA